MAKQHVVVSALLSTIFTLTIISGVLLAISSVKAAPVATDHPQLAVESFQYKSISSMAFIPVQQNSTYIKDTQRQLISITGPNRSFTLDRNQFVVPLNMPDQSKLMAMTAFGEDYDSHGEVRVRMKRCDHTQARCVNLGEITSTSSFAAGLFETSKVTLQNEQVNNSFYSYFLELELTALLNSGLRSVRLEIITKGDGSSATTKQWSLSGSVTSFSLPNTNLAQAEICADDLSHLSNPTHYPFVVVDNRSVPLKSDSCVTVWGKDIEIRRRLNTGPSSGTYQYVN